MDFIIIKKYIEKQFYRYFMNNNLLEIINILGTCYSSAY